MRIILLLFLTTYAWALDNAVRVTDRTGSAQPGRPFTLSRWFAKDEICDWPQPFADGVAVAVWQSDRVNRWPATSICPAGSVQFAMISFRAGVAASGTLTVDFRNNSSPCSASTSVTGCQAAGLSTAGALAFNGAAWNAQIVVSANPQGSTTARTISARTMLGDNRCRAWLQGPAATQYVCGPYAAGGSGYDTTRAYNFGWKERYMTRMAPGDNLTSTTTAFPMLDVTSFAVLTTPFTVAVYGEVSPVERVSICYVDTATKTLYVGTTSGTSSACASTAGRGQDGTSAGPLRRRWVYRLNAADIRLVSDHNTSVTTISVSDAATITVPARLKVRGEEIRVCAKSGNSLTAGTGSAPCAANADGRQFRGTNGDDQLPANMPVYFADASDRWIDAPSDPYKPLSPVFVLSFYTGWAGVGVEYIMENTWMDRFQDQEYDVTFQTGSPSLVTVASKTERRHVPFTRWRYPDGTNDSLWKQDRKIWTASAPGEVRYDFNLPYMRYSGLVPYDSSVDLDANGVNGEFIDQPNSNHTQPGWDRIPGNTRCEIEGTVTLGTGGNRLYSGDMMRLLSNPGARRDIALNPTWYVAPLFGMSSALSGAERLWETFWGKSACAGYSPVHWAEGTTGMKFCNGTSSTADPSKSCSGSNADIDAFGYPISRDARPLFMPFPDINPINPIGHGTLNSYGIPQGDALSHYPSMAFLPYMLSGDWFFYQEQQYLSSFGSFISVYDPGYNANNNYYVDRMKYGHGDWAISHHVDLKRGYAWDWREKARAAITAADGSPEKQYWTRKLNLNIAVYEGKYNITNGSFYTPCPSPLGTQYDHSFWCYGRHFRGYNDTQGIPATIGFDVPDTQFADGTDQTLAHDDKSDWMLNFWPISMGDAENQGITQVRPLRTYVQRRLLNMIRNTTEFLNPFALQCYRCPHSPCLPEGVPQPTGCAGQTYVPGDKLAFSSWANLYAAVAPGYKAMTGFTNDHDLYGGYARIAFAASTFMPDGVRQGTMTGSSAHDWFQGNLKNRQLDAGNPQWLFSPPWQHRVANIRVVNLTATSATVRFVRPPNADSCSYAAGTSRPASSLDSGETSVVAGNREMSVGLTGLTSGTTYYVRLTCRHARGEVSFTTK